MAQRFLKSIGVRPINNVVDITNYVLFETGHPLHAFDAAYIAGNKVVVKQLNEGSPFVTLDEVERKLTATDLMICNAEDGMCIAGVFGGEKSGVSEKTQNIFLESAYFNPVSVRKTSKHHGLKTDASFRFERGADPNITVFALKRAAILIKEICGGSISSEVVDVYPKVIEPFQVEMSYRNIDRLIGKQIPKETIHAIVNWLGMIITHHDENGMLVAVPTSKTDVQREVDVIEEILRIYSYNNIDIDQPLRSSISLTEKPDRHKLRNIVSDLMVNNGYNEIMCNSLSKSAHDKKLNFLDPAKYVRILNPISRDLDVMRQTLLTGGMETIIFNINRKSSDLRLFEFGAEYTLHPEKEKETDQLAKYNEHWKLALFTTGAKQPESWYQQQGKTDFFQVKSMTRLVLQRMGFSRSASVEESYAHDFLEYGQRIIFENQPLAFFGKLKKYIADHFDIKQEIFYAEIDWALCMSLLKKMPAVKYSEIPRFPEVRRDLALLLNNDINFGQIETLAIKNGGPLLQNVNLFDIYEGDKIEQGKKSYAVSFILRDDTRTLTDAEIDAFMNKLIKVFEKEVGARLR
jgi:phenylalanyl-tRNA synthetase beta chain